MSKSSFRPPGCRAVALLTSLATFFSLSKPALAAEPPTSRPVAAPTAQQPKSPIETLREARWLKDLPETITVPVPGDPNTVVTKRIAEATVDDIAIAASQLNRSARTLLRVVDDLQRLHDLAREAGALGSTNAAAAAVLTVRGLK
jgi:hypothetical protein